jgi:hypothetical protein
MPKLILTPVAKHYRKGGIDSRRDYEEQVHRNIKGDTWMWDDVSPSRGGNRAQVGDSFGFVFNGIKVNVHQVTHIYSPSERLPTWYQNVGQGDRQVLFLSNRIDTYTWEEWLSMNGHKKVQGTVYAHRIQLQRI